MSEALRSAAACRKADRNGSRSRRISQPVTRMDRLAHGECGVDVELATEHTDLYLIVADAGTSERAAVGVKPLRTHDQPDRAPEAARAALIVILGVERHQLGIEPREPAFHRLYSTDGVRPRGVVVPAQQYAVVGIGTGAGEAEELLWTGRPVRSRPARGF